MKYSSSSMLYHEALQRPGVLQSSGAFRRLFDARKRRRTGALQDARAFTVSRLLMCLLLSYSVSGHSQETQKKDETPVPFPKPDHFAPLWQRSIFTTKDLPSPDAPTGPNFADNYNISGVYEFDGAVTFVLADRTTSQFMEVRIGTENEFGIKVRAVKPGETVEKTRIQLQKGDQAGWISFADLSAAPPVEVRSAIPTQQSATPNQGRGMPQRQNMIAPPVQTGLPPNPILPPPSTPVPGGAPKPAAPQINDVPLPPP